MSDACENRPPPQGWVESLDRAKAEIASGDTVLMEPALERLRAAQVSPHDPVETQLRAEALSIVAFTDERQLAFRKLIIAESRRDPPMGESAFKAGKGAFMARYGPRAEAIGGEA